ncbi:hypothetical protein AB43_4172 [Escherichia coli 3-020-07_S1_C2]|nr:hypothetical protein AB43_4172 [Escherichia coli 3-020-07_S1_C2]
MSSWVVMTGSHSQYQRFAGCGDEEIHRWYQYQLNFITHNGRQKWRLFYCRKARGNYA